MSYFSRLTEIVQCNLSSILQREEDPARAIEEIVTEMQEGVDGAKRSAATAESNIARLEQEIGEQRTLIEYWSDDARERLEQEDEDLARAALVRRRECQSIVDGLEQQLQAAIDTRDHLRTTLRALQARLADAMRRRTELTGSATAPGPERSAAARHDEAVPVSGSTEIDAELESLKRELGRSL